MEALLFNFFNLAVAGQVYTLLLRGLWVTLWLSALVVPLGVIVGLLVAVLTNAGPRWVRWSLIAYVDFFRAFPPLVLLMLVYFGAPFADINLPKLVAVALAFTLTTSAYYCEVFRAGIESIPAGQVEAARSTGLTLTQTFRSVIIPQAVRNMLPDLVSNTLEVIKMTSIASVIAIPELLNNARLAQSLTYNPTPIVMAAIFYVILLWPLVRLVSWLENRSNPLKT